MHTRCEIFWRFLRRRLNRTFGESNEPSDEGKTNETDGGRRERGISVSKTSDYLDGEDEFESEEQRKEHFEKVKKANEERASKLDLVLNRSNLNTRMQVIDLPN